MAMSIAARDDSAPIADMNTTPLVDVMLVLLILFIITLPVMTNSTNVHIGKGGPIDPPPAPREAITLSIDFDGTVLWNGAVVQDLAQLEGYFKVEAGKANQAELHVLPDRRAKYDTVAQVLAIAQRSGMQRIGFAGQERFRD
ncbi:MAG TPA: biopolymer transporter ExbD [Steroidobacteraceae bacterium]|nr:biopolymer transporter ExbD [Steroidobacteraceae bacterium]